MFLVVQDEMQFQKIYENVDLENYITVFYVGRRITDISFSGVSNWLLFVLTLFNKERPIVVCEYANLVPRVIATLTGSRIHSHYFGHVYEGEIQPALEAKKNLFSKLITPLYADEFYIYGESNPMLTLENKFIENSVKFFRRTKKFIEFPPMKIDCPYVIVVGQPIFELGRAHLASCYQEAIFHVSHMNSTFEIIYVRHPRETRKEHYKKVGKYLEGSKELMDYMLHNGRPVFAFAFDSSLIYELRDVGVHSHNFVDLLHGGDFRDLHKQILLEMFEKAQADLKLV